MHTSVHESYFNVQKTYGKYKILFGVHEIKIETYNRFSLGAAESKKKDLRCFY